MSKTGDCLGWINFIAYLEVGKKRVYDIYATITFDFLIETEEDENFANKKFHFKPRTLKATRMKIMKSDTKEELPEEAE